MPGAVDDVLAGVLRPGQDIVIGQARGAPVHLIQALPRHLDRLQGSRLLVGMLPPDFPELPGVEIVTFFPSGPLGSADRLAARNARYLRCSLYELAAGLRCGTIPVDVTLAQATPPRSGRCSLGLAVDFAAPAAERADAVVLEVRPGLPWTGPRSTVAVTGRVLLVEASGAGPAGAPATGEAGPLGRNLVEWIPDGATLELGMGGWASGFVTELTRRRGLRLHTGLLGDWLLDLMRAGALDPAAPLTATAAGGSASLLRALDGAADLAPADVTHAPDTLRGLPGFRAVNSVLEVDLMGRANSETGHGGRLGGIGGLADFARGASANPDGLSILALSATSRGRSRIVPRLEGPVSLPAEAVEVVVTEYGSADLRDGDTAAALISIAAPEHRRSLTGAARELGLL